MKQETQLGIIIGIAILIVIMLPSLGVKFPKFAIVDTDIPMTTVATLNPGNNIDYFTNVTISSDNTTIYFTYMNEIQSYPDGKIIYLIDNNPNIIDNIPNLTAGDHNITKYQMTLVNNDTQISFQKGFKNIFNSVNTVLIYVPNETIINGTIYVNQTVEVDKTIQVQPTFFQQYGTAGIVLIIMGSIIIYLIYKWKK